jgi:hypothetical protein
MARLMKQARIELAKTVSTILMLKLSLNVQKLLVVPCITTSAASLT